MTLPVSEFLRAREYIRDQFSENPNKAWLEGWVCGFTDPYHKVDEIVKENLLELIKKLINEPPSIK